MRITEPFPRLSYTEVMDSYGTDKPDLRFDLEIKDLSDIVAHSDFAIFNSVIANGGKVKGICAPGCAAYPRSQLDDLNKLAREVGAGGLVPISLDGSAGSLGDLTIEMVRSVAAKYLTLEQVKEIAERLARLGEFEFKVKSGYLRRYIEKVQSASTGAVFGK